MHFVRTNIPDVIIIEPKVHGDDRGYFVETFRADKLEEFLGFKINFCQDNESKSSKGVLRGLHYQLAPFSQTKLVRVIQGRVLDVAVDIRKEAPTYGQHFAIKLSAENKKQLLIPHGFAHGFSVISETAVVLYKCDQFYNKASEGGIRFDDPTLNIDWGMDLKDAIVSDKDLVLPGIEECNSQF